MKLGKERVWVDSKRNYFPLRHERYLEGQLFERVDIHVAKSDGCWDLTGWKYVKFDRYQNCERAAEIYATKVEHMGFEASNPSDFELIFEAGTQVSKRRDFSWFAYARDCWHWC